MYHVEDSFADKTASFRDEAIKQAPYPAPVTEEQLKHQQHLYDTLPFLFRGQPRPEKIGQVQSSEQLNKDPVNSFQNNLPGPDHNALVQHTEHVQEHHMLQKRYFPFLYSGKKMIFTLNQADIARKRKTNGTQPVVKVGVQSFTQPA